MINLDNIKAFAKKDDAVKYDGIVQIVTVLLSGIVLILSLSPEYLKELHPLTLMLISIAAALPVWAMNQLLWWQLGRKMSGEMVGHMVMVINVSDKERKVLSFVLTQLMKAADIIQIVPIKKIANLITIITIYLGAVLLYFTQGSIIWLYGSIILLSLLIWMISFFLLRKQLNRIEVAYLKSVWDQLVNNEEIFDRLDDYFERLMVIIKNSPILHRETKDESSDDIDDSTEQIN